jgi:hypothetical protein
MIKIQLKIRIISGPEGKKLKLFNFKFLTLIGSGVFRTQSALGSKWTFPKYTPYISEDFFKCSRCGSPPPPAK